MKIINNFGRNYKEDPIRNWNLSKYTDSCPDYDLYYGLGSTGTQWPEDLIPDSGRKNIYINGEEPSCDPNLPRKYEERFNKVFTICPYTAEWVNKHHYPDKRVPIFIPIDSSLLPTSCEKVYNFIYTGYSINPHVLFILDNISKYRYCNVSYGSNKYTTHVNVSYLEKLRLISSSKATLVHNVLFVVGSQVDAVKKIPNYKYNEAFSHIDEGICPQLKTRAFEAALCKSLILVKKDPWNIIEGFFKPEEDFIYYTEEELPSLLVDVSNNYCSYESIVNNAYNKAIKRYTSDIFVKTYLEELHL